MKIMDIVASIMKNTYNYKWMDKKTIFAKRHNQMGLPYDIVVRKATDSIVKVFFSNGVQHECIKNIPKVLEKLNQNIHIGHFYYEYKSKEIRFLINLLISDIELDTLQYIRYALKYAECVYADYYLVDDDMKIFFCAEEIYKDKEIKVKRFVQNMEIVQLEYAYETLLSHNSVLTIINSLNMKMNLVEAVIWNNKLLIRFCFARNAEYIDDGLDHIYNYLDEIHKFLN